MELEYDGRVQGELELLLPERRQQTLQLRNDGSTAMLFKIQCTAPRKLRVRPTLGIVAAGDAVSILVLLSLQESAAFTCKLLVVGRVCSEAPAADAITEEVKTMWAAAEAQVAGPNFSETVRVEIRSSSDAEYSEDKPATNPLPPPKLSTSQIAELVLLLMKSQSRRQENALTSAECEQFVAAKALYSTEWPCWEEYATRMRKLLHERNKRKPMAT